MHFSHLMSGSGLSVSLLIHPTGASVCDSSLMAHICSLIVISVFIVVVCVRVSSSRQISINYVEAARKVLNLDSSNSSFIYINMQL